MTDVSTNGFSKFMQRNRDAWDKRLGISKSARERFLKKENTKKDEKDNSDSK